MVFSAHAACMLYQCHQTDELLIISSIHLLVNSVELFWRSVNEIFCQRSEKNQVIRHSHHCQRLVGVNHSWIDNHRASRLQKVFVVLFSGDLVE